MHSIVIRVLTKKVRAMASVDSIVANPVGHLNIIRKIIVLHSVVVAPIDPLLNADIMIKLEGWQVTAPHSASRVIRPTNLGTGVGSKLVGAVNQLHGFNTLLAKTAVIESFDGCDEVGIG